MLNLRIFISSPCDVAEERHVARKVITELENNHLIRSKIHFEVIAWDDSYAACPMEAGDTPQSSVSRYIGRPSDCDLTLIILWSRIGIVLPPGIRRPDGSRYESGTVWEFEDANKAGRTIYIYRRSTIPQINIDDPDFEAKRSQYSAVKNFFGGFNNSDGSLNGGFNVYNNIDDFAKKLRPHLEAFVNDRLRCFDEAQIIALQERVAQLEEILRSHEQLVTGSIHRALR
jgi:hypothetical protein